LSFINNITKQIAEIVLKRKQLPEKMPPSKAVNISTARTVMFFNCSSTEEFNTIIAFFKNTNTKTSLALVYCDFIIEKNKKIDSNVFMVNQNDFNIFGGFNSRLFDWLSSNNFDILLSFANGYDLFCNRIISGLSADFKAGNYHDQNVHLFDLTIKQKTDEYSKQYELFIFYLNNLNINI